ncbi:alpha/beta hydrolase [Sphingomonas sp. CGMCC 1.13654]|uniref:Alpha/beta hydrolase n=2 Tax=Sphingomonas chungangi TaxID=2683589 RepID=A0A838KZU0_9SPHN|nr:alpha/beta hydrolase [Sphingomonas chungangi]MVW56395.1 alpha/beta fold hydrolase [Sphingomonas chungangi]
MGTPAMAAPMTYAEFQQRVVQPPSPGPNLAYGPDPLQHVELWKPEGNGPFPVVLMIHGGCWQTAVAKADIMHALAADLMKRGIAVWNIEYRGVDVPGGGYPGTFQDVAAAADMLGREGPKMGLDVKRVVAVGHSAGGHLALWLAARPKIAKTSVLWTAHPLPLVRVVSLGGLPDLAKARTEAVEACGEDTVNQLVGHPTADRRDVFADTSPASLLPLGIPFASVSGSEDPIAPPAYAARFSRQAREAGDNEDNAVISDAGHFELITPSAAAWDEVLQQTLWYDVVEAPPRVKRGHPRPR